MSVLVPEAKVFKAIFNKVMAYTFNKQCDINYCSVFSGFSEKEAEEFVKNILHLNEWSYTQRYREPKDISMSESIKLNFAGETIDSIQMLKYLECVHYQIEIETIKKGYNGDQNNLIPHALEKSYEQLDQAIDCIKSTIVREFTNYDQLKWSN